MREARSFLAWVIHPVLSFKRWNIRRKLMLAYKWVDEHAGNGLTIVQIKQLAGTEYVVHRDGSRNRLGKRETIKGNKHG